MCIVYVKFGMLGELPVTSVCWKVDWHCCLCVMFTMKVNEQNRLRVRPSQVYWGNHPLLRNGANTWRTPPYQTPLNRWTTKPAKPGHGQPCRGCYMVWTHRSLDMYRWHHPKHHSSPKYPFAHPPPPHLRRRLKFCTHKTFSPVVDRDSGWAGGKGASLSPKYHRDCDIRGQQEGKK